MVSFYDSNFLVPSYAEHISFVTRKMTTNCSLMHYEEQDDKCMFARNRSLCDDTHVKYFNYLTYFYCELDVMDPDDLKLAATFRICLVVGILFFFNFALAEYFLCPAVVFIAETLFLSENFIGGTLLAFVIRLPDFLSITWPKIYDDDIKFVELVYVELIGSAIFHMTVCAGLIMFCCPFCINGLVCMRDLLFVLGSCLWLAQSFYYHNEEFRLEEAKTLVLTYGGFLGLMCIEQVFVWFFSIPYLKMFRYTKKSLRFTKNDPKSEPLPDEIKSPEDVEKQPIGLIAVRVDRSAVIREKLKELQTAAPPPPPPPSSATSTSTDPAKEPVVPAAVKHKSYVLRQCVVSLETISYDEWKKSNLLGMIVTLYEIPFVFFFLWIIPCVDLKRNLHGWNKLLNIIQLLLWPIGLLYLVDVLALVDFSWVEYPIFGWEMQKFVGVTSLVLAIIFYFTSTTIVTPWFHIFFAVLTVCISVVIFTFINGEIVSMSYAAAIISQWDLSLAGMILKSCGHHFFPLVVCLAMARYGRMVTAFTACISSAMLYFVAEIGGEFYLKLNSTTSEDYVVFARDGVMSPNCTYFITITIVCLFMALMFTDFQARRSIGVHLLFIYCAFIWYGVQSKAKGFHPYGTDHHNEGNNYLTTIRLQDL